MWFGEMWVKHDGNEASSSGNVTGDADSSIIPESIHSSPVYEYQDGVSQKTLSQRAKVIDA